MKVSVYDCFTFFNELDILELRLGLLYDVVDKFVLVESTKTNANNDKELYYENNKHRFKKYNDKIIHVVVSAFPEYRNSWTFENFQRNEITKALGNCAPDDLILISDVDEIPNPDVIRNYDFKNEMYCLVQNQYFFFYNYRDLQHLFWIGGTKVFRYRIIKENLLKEKKVRYNETSFPSYLNKGTTATKIRLYDGCKFIYNGGWHFSYLGGVAAIVNKVKAFAHQELNNDHFLDTRRIEECLVTGADIFGRKGHKFIRVAISEKTHPSCLQEMEKDPHLIFFKTPVHTVSVIKEIQQLLKIKLVRVVKRII